MKNKRIGLFGGTFNPIHFGHLNLAVEMFEKHELSSVYFFPAHLNPLKINHEQVLARHRLKMLELALEDNPNFFILQNELMRPPPSFTIDTIEELLQTEESSTACYYLIIGEDSLASFPKWHRAEEIVRLTPLLIGARSGSISCLCDNPEIERAIAKGITLTKIIDISSSEVRERIKQQKYCSHLVPSKVLDYIYANRLYSNS